MLIEPSRIASYETRYGVELAGRLGAGANGEVYSTSRRSAVKFFYLGQEESYQRERHAYTILGTKSVREVLGHKVPSLLACDDELLAIEMTVVTPPYLLDFASAYRAEDVPDFPPEVWENYEVELRERFEGNLEEAERIISEFQKLTGLVLLDPHGANIRFM